MNVTLTEMAELRLRTFLKIKLQSPRIGVHAGGCGGYEYHIKLVRQPQPDNILIDNGLLRMYVDPVSAPLLDGLQIDYIEGLVDSGFKFLNPNAAETCSCGKSFRSGPCSPAGVACTSAV